jgi:hypothetical protein
MSSNQKIMMYVGIGLLVTLAVIGLWMLLQCKGVKHGGKCHPILAQSDPTVAAGVTLADIKNIVDGKMDTGAGKTTGTSATTITLNVKDAPKKVKGAKITAKAAVPPSGTTAADQTIKLDTLEFPGFKQDDKTYTVIKAFSTEADKTTMSLVVPSGVTVYEVQLF